LKSANDEGNVIVTDLSIWRPWLKRNAVLATLLRGASNNDPASYLVRVHAISEAVLRRIVLVGLRKNLVQYSDAVVWLTDNDETPSRAKYPVLFDRLYGPQIAFETICPQGSSLYELWELWLDFAKIVRNHVSHGIRQYDDAWLQCAINVDQAFIIQMCQVMEPHIGGSIGGDLRKLKPRLSMGRAGIDIPALLGIRARNPRPSTSLHAAQARFNALEIV
jgi:hypothetical protein